MLARWAIRGSELPERAVNSAPNGTTLFLPRPGVGSVVIDSSRNLRMPLLQSGLPD